MKTARHVPIKPGATALPAVALRTKLLSKDMRTARLLAHMQRRIYPKEMWEDARTILSVLESTDMSRGLFLREQLLGYAIFQGCDEERTIYLYDFAVLPHLQHKGLGTKLARDVLAAAWRKTLKIKMHVRETSYPLFANRDKLRTVGYRLVSDKFVRDFYFGEFGIHEDAHELVMEPVTHRPLTSVPAGVNPG